MMDNKVNNQINNMPNLLHYRPSIDKWRLVFVFLAAVYTYGLPYFGKYGQVILGFAFPALYIISGFLVLRPAPDRLQRIGKTIKKTAICFIILFAAYLICSLAIDASETIKLITSSDFWIKFLLLNVCELRVGLMIWYVQALLYAYIIIYLLEKFELLRFDWLFALICILFTVYSSDLAAFTGFQFMGRAYLAGNFITRALPYILIGGLIHRHLPDLIMIGIPEYIIIAVAGIGLSVGEYALLTKYFKLDVYHAHYIWMGIAAAAICIPIFLVDKDGFFSDKVSGSAKYAPRVFYYIFPPVYYFVIWIIAISGLGDFESFSGLAAALICLIFALIYAVIGDRFRDRKLKLTADEISISSIYGKEAKGSIDEEDGDNNAE